MNGVSLKLNAGPASEPILLADAKNYLRVDGTADDALITLLITAAREQVEMYLNRKLINQTWDVYYDSFGYSNSKMWWDGTVEGSISMLNGCQPYLKLPLSPLSSITSFVTIDNQDVEYTFNASNYYGDVARAHPRVALREGATWPATVLRTTEGIRVRAVFGYGADGTAVPKPIILAIYETLAGLYQCRGECGSSLPDKAMTLLAQYRVPNV